MRAPDRKARAAIALAVFGTPRTNYHGRFQHSFPAGNARHQRFGFVIKTKYGVQKLETTIEIVEKLVLELFLFLQDVFVIIFWMISD